MHGRFRVSSLLAKNLQERDISTATVIQRAGLPSGFFAQEKISATTEQFFALWRAIEQTSGDPGIGLKMGAEWPVERYDPAAIAALCSRTYQDALARLARYKQLTCPEEIRLSTPDRGELAIEFHFVLGHHAEPMVLVDLCLAWVLAIGRRGTGFPITPLRLESTRHEPQHRQILEAHFGCPVKLDSVGDALILRTADVKRPFVTHNAQLLAMLAPQLEEELNARRSSETPNERVKAALKSLLAGHRPLLSEVALHLGLSPRTLQRRLTENGVTFQRLLEEGRRELAQHYLSKSSLELNEIAYLLGYDDANSFFRAFQHWEGTSPGQWRALCGSQKQTTLRSIFTHTFV